MVNRRRFLLLASAPAIVRVSTLMPISMLDPMLLLPWTYWYQNLTYWAEVDGYAKRVMPPEHPMLAVQRLAAQLWASRHSPRSFVAEGQGRGGSTLSGAYSRTSRPLG